MALKLNKLLFILRSNSRPVFRRISTSGKKSDTVAISEKQFTVEEAKKNWVSYGFSKKSEKADRSDMHMVFFGTVSIGLVLSSFIWAYGPDRSFKDWSRREAYIELHRREKAGLPLIDPNLIDPRKVKLPSDEALGNTEIII